MSTALTIMESKSTIISIISHMENTIEQIVHYEEFGSKRDTIN